MGADKTQDFWTHIVGTAYWQVFLILLTAFITSWLTQYFVARYKNAARLRECKSIYRKHGYMLGQMLLSRLQDEIHTNIYEYRLAHDKSLNGEMRTAIVTELQGKVTRIAAAALEINAVYGEIMALLTEMQLLIGDEAFETLEPMIKQFVDIRSIPVHEIADGNLDKYAEEETARVHKHVIRTTMARMNVIYNYIKPLGLKRPLIFRLKGL